MFSFTEENYLKAIFKHSQKEGGEVSTNTIADELNTKAASVTDMLRKLADKGLINYEKYKGVTLTKAGRSIAVSIIRKHRLWEVFLCEKLKFRWDEVHEVAEQLEHIHSDLLIDQLDEFLGYPKNDPHGDPIPDKNGEFPKDAQISVENAQVGTHYTISGVSDEDNNFLKYLNKLEISLGLPFEVLERFEFDGSMTVKIGEERSLQISKEVAQNLFVAKI
jgi:DtxR family transcriptional regulator, Mn-dependent transcriptional regulator